ncbi:MAG: threonylcarbamoyl-AMP synthase [Candidatus Caenarcaniphilales bacterium]|nr:threonylcarbamoyl-AMP synthase [Candidatus Caenarcaniphilales bacterium]
MIYESTSKNIKQAVELLKSGEVVAIPTETVYGLAADASNTEAVEKIFQIKGRPNFNPLISHYADIDEIRKDVEFNEKASILAEKFWPGPMTLVLNKTKNSRISDLVSAKLKTAAVRIPKHEITLELLSKFSGPLAAPSANPSGKLSPSKAIHVEELFQSKLNFILDGGPCQHGLESTVIDLSENQVKVLRYGSISLEEIESVLKEKVLPPESETGIKAPGMLLKHYSPKTHLEINLKLEDILQKQDKNKNIGLILFGEKDLNQGIIQNLNKEYNKIINLSKVGDCKEAAQKLFNSLHELDKFNLDKILIQEIPNMEIGLAINDRLRRAAEIS